MSSSLGWRRALAGCLVLVSVGCNDPAAGAGGTGGAGGLAGTGGLGGAGGDCTTDAINACLDLQNCCRAILVNPVFFQACNDIVLQCDKQQCDAALAGYIKCRDLEL